MIEPESTTTQAPVRVVQVQIPNRALSEELFAQGTTVRGCTAVFRNMLPVPPVATLHGVTRHGLLLRFEPEAGEHDGLLVPWGQVSYLKLSLA